MIKDIMEKNPKTLNPENTIIEAARLFLKYDVDGIPVVDSGKKILGFITKRHIIEAFVNRLHHDTPVKDIMITKVVTINENYSVEKAWDCHVKTMPVLNNDGKVVGLLTRTNLVKGYYRDLQEVKRLNRELNAIIESSYDGFYITDGKGITLRINSAYQRITGIKPEEVIGRSMKELVEKGVYSQSVTLLVLEKRKPVTIMHDIKTGKRVLITGNPVFNEKGEIVRVVTNVRDITELINLKKQLEETRELTERYQLELQELRNRQINFDNIVARSLEMKRILEIASRVAEVDTTVLITGESGVGKEVIARGIHMASKRREGPFIKVNCAAIPENLLESELFGYEKGAFTGANREGKPGMFELADKGTIFLDEIGELPLHLQPKLLRVIQDKELIRVGGADPVKLDVRIIAATNKNLEEMAKKGEFREDLFYRLNVVPINILPLRERKDDIPPLIIHFVNKFNGKYGLNKKISSKAVDYLIDYSWPGNVRELENVIERLIVLTKDDIIEPENLPASIRGSDSKIGVSYLQGDSVSLKEAVEGVEKNLIAAALRKYGTTRKAARALNVNQSTIVRKAKKYGISVK